MSTKLNESNSKDSSYLQVTNIHSLPELILTKIFRYLSIKQRCEVEKVCQFWETVSFRSWGDVKHLIIMETASAYEHMDDVLSRCGHHLEKLEISVDQNAKALELVSEFCSNLRRLTILGPRETYHCSSAKYLDLRKMENLKYLKVADCEITTKLLKAIEKKNTLTEFTLERCITISINNREFFKNLRHIECLDLSDQYFPAEDFIKNIGDNCPKLRQLKISDFNTISNLAPISHLEHLEHLEMTRFLADDSFLKMLANKCKKIKHLRLSFCNAVTDDGIKYLGHLGNLESLQVFGLSNISDRSLCFLKKLKILECIGCYAVGDTGIISFIQCANKLEKLEISNTRTTTRTLVEAEKWKHKYPDGSLLTIVVDTSIYKAWKKSTWKVSSLKITTFPTVFCNNKFH